MITPLDIENKKFAKQVVNGYSVDEVDDFLDDVTVEYEKLFKENAEYKEKVTKLEHDIEHYKSIEASLQSTLIMAQSTAEDVKKVAQQKADQIVSEAKVNAQKEVDSLENQIVLKQHELDDAQKQFDIYKAKMESLLISQLEILKDMSKE